MKVLRIEKAAYSAQQESMVQLVVVAPSVNVSLGGDFANSVCTHDMAIVQEKVSSTITDDVMPGFLKVFATKLPDGNTGSLPHGTTLRKGQVNDCKYLNYLRFRDPSYL